MAALTLAGEYVQASVKSLPAATVYGMPASIDLLTALFSAPLGPLLPRLMLATASTGATSVTQSTPSITPAFEPEPPQSRTRTATRSTSLATPHFAPPTVPATCVPCPLQSFVPLPSLIAEKPLVARPSNVLCVMRMPVSMTYTVTPRPVESYRYLPSRE